MEKKQVFGVKTGIFKENDGSSSSKVIIEVNGRTKYHTFQLQEPCRVVIDIENAVLALRKPDFPIEDGVIERIRLFQFTPSTVRVVLDLIEPFFYDHAIEKHRVKNTFKYNIVVAIKRDDHDASFDQDNFLLKDKVIVIDPGHGGRDAGICAGGLREKDVVLKIALCLNALLDQTGATVLLTRSLDQQLPLKKRIEKANNIGADVFLSLHCSCFKDATARGIETSHFRNRGVSKVLATLLLEELTKVLDWPNRGVKVASYLVLRQAKVSAALVEMGFLSNPEEANYLALEETHLKIAEGLARGIIRYFTELT